MSSSFDLYQEYLNLKTHFNQMRFNYFKSTAKCSEESFEDRPDKKFFQYLTSLDEPRDHILSNLIYNRFSIPYDLCLPEAEVVYKKWRTRQDFINESLERDIRKLDRNYDENFLIYHTRPLILDLYYKGDINLESLSIICSYWNKFDKWKKMLDPIWKEQLYFSVVKYYPFIDYDKDVYYNTINEHLSHK